MLKLTAVMRSVAAASATSSADSALVTKANLAAADASGIRFVSRLPRTFDYETDAVAKPEAAWRTLTYHAHRARRLAPAQRLLVSRSDDAGTGLLDLRELGLHLGLKAGILERQPGCCSCHLDQVRLVAKDRIVHDGSERFAVVLEQRHGSGRSILGNWEAVNVDESVLLRQPEEDLEGRVAERGRKLVSDTGRGDILESQDKVADVRVGETGTDKAGEEGERQGDER